MSSCFIWVHRHLPPENPKVTTKRSINCVSPFGLGLPAYPAVPKMDSRPPLNEGKGGGSQAIRRRQSTHSVFTKFSFKKFYTLLLSNLLLTLTGSLWHRGVLESRGLVADWREYKTRFGSAAAAGGGDVTKEHSFVNTWGSSSDGHVDFSKPIALHVIVKRYLQPFCDSKTVCDSCVFQTKCWLLLYFLASVRQAPESGLLTQLMVESRRNRRIILQQNKRQLRDVNIVNIACNWSDFQTSNEIVTKCDEHSRI